MNVRPEHIRLFEKLRHLSDTIEEIDSWTASRTGTTRDETGVDVPSLLQSLLAKRRVTPENVGEFMEEG